MVKGKQKTVKNNINNVQSAKAVGLGKSCGTVGMEKHHGEVNKSPIVT